MYCDLCMGINSDKCPNCGREPICVPCPDCNGSGVVAYWAMHRKTGEETQVTAEAWECIPATAAEAYAKNENYYRLEAEKCETCNGTGEIYVEDEL